MPHNVHPPWVPPQRDIEVGRRRVLLVGGEDATRALVAEELCARGLTVDEAVDAHDALAIVDYAPPDVVVYSLGWGAGLHALDRLREAMMEHGDRAPAIVLTTPGWARAHRGITLRGRVPVPELLDAIERAVRQRGSAKNERRRW